MGTKMKGLLKGLRYITQIFDEEKEQEIQIGYPTDVKHVAHIGQDGPSVDSPSWMKGFESGEELQSAPSSVKGQSKENSKINCVSQDKSSIAGSSSQQPSAKPRQSKRNSSGSSRGTRQPNGSGLGSDAPLQSLPDIPKKSIRKKSKELVGGEGSTRSSSRSKVIPPPTPYTSPFSDPGPDTKSKPGSNNSELTYTSSMRPLVKGDKECNGIS
ncbi:unnamed protein product [Camellia sinensis]